MEIQIPTKKRKINGLQQQMKDSVSRKALNIAFYYSVLDNNKEMINILLGARPYIREDYIQEPKDLTFLQVAIRNKSENIVRFLLERGFDPDAKNGRDQSAIHFLMTQKYTNYYTDADDNKFISIAKLLLRYGADVNSESINKTVFYDAARLKDDSSPSQISDDTYEKILELLLKYGVEINMYYLSNNPIEMIFKYGTKKAIGMFMEHVDDLEAFKEILSNSFTFLSAIQNKRLNVLKYMFSIGLLDIVQLHHFDERLMLFPQHTRPAIKSHMIMDEAIKSGRVQNVIYLIEIFERNTSPHIWNYLRTACNLSNMEIVRLLLSYRPLLTDSFLSPSAIIEKICDSSRKNISEFVLRYAAQRETLSSALNLEKLNLSRDCKKWVKDYYERCIAELKDMQSFYVYKSLSMFDILINNNLNLYIRDNEFIEKFEEECTVSKFPIYYDSLKESVDKEKQHQILLKAAAMGLCVIFDCKVNQFPLIINDGILHYLNEKDLMKLAFI